MDEAWAIGSLSDVATESHYAVERLVSYPWFTDGILPDEATVVTALGSMSYELGAGAEFIGMRFLESIEPSDAIALMSLEFLSYDSPAMFRRVMSHPSVADGITDDETVVLALLSDVQITKPDMVDTLLDQSNVHIERRSIELHLAGDVELAIVRLQPGAARAWDFWRAQSGSRRTSWENRSHELRPAHLRRRRDTGLCRPQQRTQYDCTSRLRL